MTRIFLHPLAGVLSAYGMGLADITAMREEAVELKLEMFNLARLAEILDRLQLAAARVFVSSFDRPNIRYAIAEKSNAREQLLSFIRAEHDGDAGIVYCLSRRKVDETAAWLTEQGIPALPYHAGLEQATRARHQARFVNEEGLVMVATIAFGMGIDKQIGRAHV